MSEGSDLPDPLLSADGSRAVCPERWRDRREKIRAGIVELEYGGMPPFSGSARGEELHRAGIRHPFEAKFLSYRVHADVAGQPFAFLLMLIVPPQMAARYPVVLTGDACWRYATDEVTAEVLRRGYILAQFNRTEIAPDVPSSGRTSGIYPLYPGSRFGALSAWAWGYQRCVDVLAGLDFVDPARIAVVGHSRGGKASLLAGATDDRIALTSANGSGCGGAGSFRQRGAGSEMLADVLRQFPYWFGPQLPEFAGREHALPFDQHYLTALVAPRSLLITEALGDLWANPSGTWQTFLATREVYRFLGEGEGIGIVFREGQHAHLAQDWQTFLDFADAQFGGVACGERFSQNPFPDQPPAFTWRA